MSTFGERLKIARKRKGLSQMEVFDAIGLSNKSLSRYEKGDTAPSPETLKRLIRLYDVSSEYILGLTSEMGHSSDSAQEGENLIAMSDGRAGAERLLSFISSGPTMFHAADNIMRRLQNEGFVRLNEWEDWDIKRGGKYFICRNGSSVIAFKVGDGDPKGFSIFSAHSDSPVFKLKPDCEIETLSHYVRLNTERYGGMIMSTWLDRPLSVAGRVIVNRDGGLRSVLVNLEDFTVLIPNVAIHMNRDVNSGYNFNPQVDMLPLLGSEKSKGSLMRKVAEAAGVKEKDIVSSDLYLYNKTPGVIWGEDGEFVSSPRLDDMQCACAGLSGLLNGGARDNIAMLCVFDNEEVGSSTKQGADSDFLVTAVSRICRCLGIDSAAALARSFAVSADNAHAVHPNHPEYADPVNRPFMNCGIVIKHNAAQKYATDAVSEAIFKKICTSVAVPVQSYANRSDIAGGGTLGNISATRLSVPTVDIGLAQLAMHSCYETAGTADTLYLERAAAELFRTVFEPTEDGGYELRA